MYAPRWFALLVGLTSLLPAVLPAAQQPPTADLAGYRDVTRPFLQRYCADCHGPDLQEGQLSLHTIDPDLLSGAHFETWRIIYDQLRFGDMPPATSEQPASGERDAVLAWIRGELLKTQGPEFAGDGRLSLPDFGNYVDHRALFDPQAGPVVPAAPRLWRMRPDVYAAVHRQVGDSSAGLSNPFTLRSEPGIKDYAAIYYVDEATADILYRNAESVVENQLRSNKYRAIKRLTEAEPPSEEEVGQAIGEQFRLCLRRSPDEDELARFTAFHRRTSQAVGHEIAGRAMLVAILMQGETIFRLELGENSVDEHGRRRLAPLEIAEALSFALGNQFEGSLFQAAEQGELATREQVAAQVQRLLEDERQDHPRIMDFFREYFGYGEAINVFKDDVPRTKHDPGQLVKDLEFLIADILAADHNVLVELLTTNRAYVNYSVDRKRGTSSPGQRSPLYETAYGLPPDWKWTDQQPIELPADQRAGVLTHPAWLVAWSGNFDNDPVRRGKWIRLRLLGGTMPDVPIGVDARIPEDEHATLRARLASATTAAECWRCHKRMDPLGLPFEQYDHYGRFRQLELDRPVDTTGRIDRVEVAELIGPVESPVEMMHRLARSEHVEQVFVRHAFRYFLGRNETLGDARTLQQAQQAYRSQGGSFKALVVSLLSSDSFLYRQDVQRK